MKDARGIEIENGDLVAIPSIATGLHSVFQIGTVEEMYSMVGSNGRIVVLLEGSTKKIEMPYHKDKVLIIEKRTDRTAEEEGS